MNRLVLAAALILAVYAIDTNLGGLPQVGSGNVAGTAAIYTGKLSENR